MSKKKNKKDNLLEDTDFDKIFNTDDDDDDDDNDSENFIQSNITRRKTYIVNLDEQIGNANNYRKLFYVLENATSMDIVKLNINSYGGYMHSTIQICSSLLKTEAKTIAEIFTACSAASIIALHCDEINVNNYATWMVHCVSWRDSGKFHEIQAHSTHMDKKVKHLFKTVYQGFLTPDEIQKALDGKDYWFYNEEIEKRLKKRTPMRDIISEQSK